MSTILRIKACTLSLDALAVADPHAKAAARALFDVLVCAGLEPRWTATESPPRCPACPPRLVPPKAVPTHSPHTAQDRAALLHTIALIEFNAINFVFDVLQ